MQHIIQMSEEEYQELLKAKSEPDQLLRDTNIQLKQKLDKCQVKLEQGAFDNCKLESPFIVTNEHLRLRSPTDFIILYNNLRGPTLTSADAAIFDYITTLAKLFNYEPQFAEQRDLKAYRVSLQKKKLCKPVRRDGIFYLQIPTKDTL